MPSADSERTFATLGPALRMLGVVLAFAAAQSARGLFRCTLSLVSGAGAHPLPDLTDLLCGLLAVGAGAFFLRHADENSQALARGPSVLPPLTLLRLFQPRFEHPLRELWSRSEPAAPEEPMPRSRMFGALWALGLAIAVPLWAFALVAPGQGRLPMLLLDAAHHAAIVGACATAFHFAAVLAARQEEAWAEMRPSVITVPVRLARSGDTIRISAAPKRAPVPVPTAAAEKHLEPPVQRDPQPEVQPEPAAAFPSACVVCKSSISSRRCEKCGAPAVAGPFRILRALGGSGGRRTFLALSPDRKQVALKELSFASAPDAQALEAFAREARTLRELRHPRLPVYVDAFREEDGATARLYLAYRYLEGVSLAQEMVERRYTEDEVLDLVEEVLEILRHLHGLQPPLIHRDLKPANLVRRDGGTVALIDFGVARDLDRTVNSGTLVGTVGYMPPEQLAGQVDITCDLYALGATALHLLTRRPPWEFMDGPELRLPRLKTAPTARALLQRLVAPRRAHRFSSAREALAALRRLRSGGSRVPRSAWAAAAVCALTVGAAGYGMNRRLEAQQAPAAAPIAAARPQNPPPPARPETRTPTPQVTVTAAVPAAAPVIAPRVEPAPLVTWKGGALSRAEVEDGLRRLPPWLKVNRPWWIQQHVLGLVRRKLLVAEAERREMSALLPPSVVDVAERERFLARALLVDEAHKEADPLRARAIRKTWERMTEALASAAEIRFDEQQLFQIDPERLVGALPTWRPISGGGGRVEFHSRNAGHCVLDVHPLQRRYGGSCERSKRLADALLEPDNLHLVDLAPGSEAPVGFYTRMTDDFVELRRPVDTLEAAARAEGSMTRMLVQLAGTSGTISTGDALTLLQAAKWAVYRCLAVALFEARFEPLRATARIRVELRPGGSAKSQVESSPELPAEGCGMILARPEVGGAGAMTFAAELERVPPRR